MNKFSFIREKLKLNNKKPLLKQVALLLVTAMLFIVAVFAWFTSHETAEADGLKITMGTSKNLEISLDGGSTYHNGLNLLSDDHQEFIGETNKIKGKLAMLDITSDGLTFLRPVFKQQEDGIREPDTTENWDTANKNTAYIAQTIRFRTTFPAEIFIGKDTAITTKSEILVGENSGNKSANGDFSKDCIVGALRISAIDSNNNLCFTMIPRSDVELVENSGTFSVNYSGTPGEAVSDNTKIHTYYNSSKAIETNNSPLLSFSATEDLKPSDDTTMIATTTRNEETGYYEGYATINIWLEGCDPETRRALSGGHYSIVLDFVAYETAEATEPTAE